jgi:hypothetical protein
MLRLRRNFDVSAEAYLIRAAKTTEEPVLMFVASPEEEEGKSVYRIDYTVPSSTWDGPDIRGLRFPMDSVIGNCRGIGHTEPRQGDHFRTPKC